MNNLKIIAHIVLYLLSWILSIYAVVGFFLNAFGITNLQYSYLLLCAVIGSVIFPILRFKIGKVEIF